MILLIILYPFEFIGILNMKPVRSMAMAYRPGREHSGVRALYSTHAELGSDVVAIPYAEDRRALFRKKVEGIGFKLVYLRCSRLLGGECGNQRHSWRGNGVDHPTRQCG